MTKANPLYRIDPNLRKLARLSWNCFKAQPVAEHEVMSRAEAFRIAVLDMAVDYYETILLGGDMPNMTVLQYLLAAPALRGNETVNWALIADKDTMKLGMEMTVLSTKIGEELPVSENASALKSYWNGLFNKLSENYPQHLERVVLANVSLETIRPAHKTAQLHV